jgi:hypothetical protein
VTAVHTVWMVGLVATGGTRLVLPLPGWTSTVTTQVVAEVQHPVAMLWMSHRYELVASVEGRVSVWLPVFQGRNAVEIVSDSGEGRAAVQFLGRMESPDLVVVAGWPPVGVRLDLRVVDPDGETCDSKNRRTEAGGLRLRDDPESPGPHVFMVAHARSGEYRVSIACGRLPEGGLVNVSAFAILFPGRPQEERIELSAPVTRCDELTELGTIRVPPPR